MFFIEINVFFVILFHFSKFCKNSDAFLKPDYHHKLVLKESNEPIEMQHISLERDYKYLSNDI